MFGVEKNKHEKSVRRQNKENAGQVLTNRKEKIKAYQSATIKEQLLIVNKSYNRLIDH